ncbi:glycosyltransferase N-terminal domain-containing protein [Acetobacter orleanensis]|uniref:3-deoxy-D-manno-octulosonic acid transferase n=1 Tax=Acetobacter orleanensis TaxID=104099 RepID=A0A4Y3TIS6_9PROT|nr:glycosyltransferase N-terminal domain-containing protein [Acetobacter orleanensis]KXV61972.1 3-deoxy-D-manno-octulosonic acid transferase [Acetobacter orleanensis]PCD80305.1 3-deoxy-D-manno-octulosonic acid transferase [Acetobacter orleanensis]GAN68949.1 3-deoxy-D-manno-octulosonic-acid transferase [Acetobacter orleanensis JCM 7639]GBR30639.1 3-deoxy-D-manno-octulosonic-acid transferase [Acetobacter orleanensis NRIC 0473]GEB81643.1 hypothetical protein AOR01nite_01200 [Acetobacter orleanens
MARFSFSAGSLARKILVSTIRGYLGFALRTTRWTLRIDPEARKALFGEGGGTIIVAFWHESLPLIPALWWWSEGQNPAMRAHVLISRNRDGRLIADIINQWRIWSIAGSSDTRRKNKGGAAALRAMRAILQRHGGLVAITPDGPQGPRRCAQPGAVALASHAGKPIIPIGATCRGIRLKSWDKMVVPLPFGRGHFVCGAPLFLSRKQDALAERSADQLLSEAITKVITEAEQSGMDHAGCQAEKISLGPLSLQPSWIWGWVATVLAPALPFLLRWRQTRGKELPDRVREKMGFASQVRPAGQLIWFHAASVGELVSILPLVQLCLDKSPALTALVTTGTVTAARLLSQRLAHPRLVHQFVPLDVPRWGQRFLTHWQPQAVVFTESELWPNLIGLCHKQNIPVALVNGRMSERSFKNWSRFRPVARRMLERFAWIAARSDKDAEHFRQLGARSLIEAGDLKTAAPPLPVDQAALHSVECQLAGRPVFLAASTHDGEEEALRPVVQTLQARFPSLLTLIVPRHPERGAAVSALFGGASRRALGQVPAQTDPVWVCDTLGELGLFYRLAGSVFLGNSLPEVRTGGGGHNPFEPARLDCALATGPRVQNFQEAFTVLGESVTTVSIPADLADWVRLMLDNPARQQTYAAQVKAVATANMDLPQMLADKVLALLSS